jgi:hypothetical protein
MMSAQKNSPVLKAGGLWAKTSAKGRQYLTGRLGGVKVLIMANRDRQSDDEPSHHLFFVEAPNRRQGGQERGGGSGGAHKCPRRAGGSPSRIVAASRGQPAGMPTCRRGSGDHGEGGSPQVHC